MAAGKSIISASLITLGIWISSCEEPENVPFAIAGGHGVFVCNEGNYTFGNASLSFYNSDSLFVQNQVFFKTNLFPPGDILQSMTIKDTIGYMVVNNSGKILVINTNTFRHVATIGGLTSPRHIRIVDHHKAYVSDLYSKSISIIDPQNYMVTGSIYIGGTTEQMVSLDSKLYATGWSMNNMIYKIDTGTDMLEDSLQVGLQPNSMVADKYGMLWILSDGGYPGSPAGNEIPALSVVEPHSFSKVREFRFPEIGSSPSALSINGGGDTIYYIHSSWTGSGGGRSGVYRMPVTEGELPDQPFIPEQNRLFYGLGIDPISSEIYVSDAIDFLREGRVFRYKPDGMAIDSFRVDIAPGSFCFR